MLQEEASATLRPRPALSKDWDDTQHVFVEGDNLEVLKIMQRAYYGQVKMIYIDPPYNTGRDFVYADNYRQSKADYNADQKQHSGDGQLNLNAESEGRFHANWLNMIYPRLALARNLLRDNGVIFISIDDNEFANLRAVCNEIFGEENFRNVFVTRRHDKNLNKQFAKNGLKSFNVGFEYILAYAKSDAFQFRPVYQELDEKRKNNGYWKGFWNDADRPTMRYDILGFTPPTGQWKWARPRAEEAIHNYQEYLDQHAELKTLEEYWKETGRTKSFIRRNPKGKGKNRGVDAWIAPAQGKLRTSNWTDLLASRSDATTRGLFDFPKNPDVIALLLESALDEDEALVLDFFAGSSTTAHAVLNHNRDHGTRHRYFMVQIPEPVPAESKAADAGYQWITEVSRARIDNVVTKLHGDKDTPKAEDLGYRTFSVAPSNFAAPESSPVPDLFAPLAKSLAVVPSDADDLSVLHEILLGAGVPLDAPIETRALLGHQLYWIKKSNLAISLLRKMRLEVVKAVVALEPNQWICLEQSFTQQDALRLQAREIFRREGINFVTV